ncbi:MAG: hypothetical protein PHS66_06655 [Candidatus Omnitrophica bacterium]|nr:hypothetical protein [Candidatus Omnitrophota bacterium]
MKNKKFKQQNSLSGQIFPLLLICIAALIVAAKISISAGKGAVNKTSVSNGADACSLAAGSVWAAAFNNLVTKNQEMENYYIYALASYTYLYSLADDEGEEFTGYTRQGIKFLDLAQAQANSALAEIKIRGDVCERGVAGGKIWTHQKEGADFNAKEGDNENDSPDSTDIRAAGAAFLAARFFLGRAVLAYYMQFLTSTFKQNQIAKYCNARASMDQAFEDAKATGIQYAFENSGTSGKSPNGDAFSLWLGTGKYKDDPSFQDTSTNATYNWKWDSKCGTSECGATVILDTPKITDYKLRRTLLPFPSEYTFSVPAEVLALELDAIKDVELDITDDPFHAQAYLYLTTIMAEISARLQDYSILGRESWQATKNAQSCCETVDDDPNAESTCDTAIKTYYDNAQIYVNTLLNGQTEPSFVAGQTKMCAALDVLVQGGGLCSGACGNLLLARSLQASDKYTFNDVWNTEGWTTTESLSTESGETCTSYDDLTAAQEAAGADDESAGKAVTDFMKTVPMFIAIGDEPVFEGPPAPWQNKCSITSYCNNIYSSGTNSCGGSATTSTSTSEFQGEGALKTFDDKYETEIISTS